VRFTQAQYDAFLARNSPPAGIESPRAKRAGSAPLEEAQLHTQILAHCRSQGWIAFHGSMAHSTFRTLGEPDFTILADGGRIFWIECKTQTGKVTTEQLGIHAWMSRLGHACHVVRSFEEFLAVVS
jgi:hypothetical protein